MHTCRHEIRVGAATTDREVGARLEDRTRLVMTDVDHAACDFAHRVQRKNRRIAQKQAIQVEALKHQLRDSFPVRLWAHDVRCGCIQAS